MQSLQELKSISVDVKAAAKLKYMQWSGDFNAEVQTKSKEINAFDSKVSNTKEIYIGSKPNKDWTVWANSIKQDPAPIDYKVVSLSDLFIGHYFPELSFDVLKEMRLQLNTAIDLYCNRIGCAPPQPDPVPGSLTATYISSALYGGNTGLAFRDSLPINPMMMVKKVMVRSGASLDAIQLELTDGVTTMVSPYRGGYGGYEKVFNVPDDQWISQIEIRSGSMVDSVRFVTNKGIKSEQFGGNTGNYYLVNLPGPLVGLEGRSGSRIDQLGFVSGIRKYE